MGCRGVSKFSGRVSIMVSRTGKLSTLFSDVSLSPVAIELPSQRVTSYALFSLPKKYSIIINLSMGVLFQLPCATCNDGNICLFVCDLRQVVYII